MAKFNHIDVRGTKKVPSAFGNVFISADSISAAKTVTFPDGYLNGATPEPNLAFKVVFANGHNASNASSYLSLNGVVVVSNQNGTLAPLPIHEMTEGGSTVYKVLDANTALELYYTEDYDGDNHPAFVVVGNPLVLSSSTYSIYANGLFEDRGEKISNSTTINGPDLFANLRLKIMFTSNITGSNTTTPLTLIYNGVSVAVKSAKNGSFNNVYAHNVYGTYIYFQAYTTIELMFDGVQFIINGNPVVLSAANYSVYADGLIEQWGSVSSYTTDNGEKRMLYFPIPFSNTNYDIQTTLFSGGLNYSTYVYNNYIREKTTTYAVHKASYTNVPEWSVMFSCKGY